jgi:hypothetical protein
MVSCTKLLNGCAAAAAQDSKTTMSERGEKNEVS